MNLVKDNKNRNLGHKEHVCRICGARGNFQSYLVREMMKGTRDEFEYFVCPECMCLQIAEVPDNLGHYYGTDYYSMKGEETEDITFDSPVTDETKILDMGCGAGKWLLEKAKEGYGNLYGCDPFIEEELRYGDRVYIKKCDISGVTEDGTYDVIRMADSFEHVTNPKEVLLNAARLIKDSGIVMMSIPLFPNIAFDMFETHWYQLDAPRHIFLHSIKSMKYLARECGLEIYDIKYDSDLSQIVYSFFYQHGITFNEVTTEIIKDFFSDQELIKINETAENANREKYGDHAQIYLRKKQQDSTKILKQIKENASNNCKPDSNFELGDFSYYTTVSIKDETREGDVKVRIGKFSSIGPGVEFLLGVEHRVNWNTTYPFKVLMGENSKGEASAFSKGDIIVGNDVWIGANAVIMSGVEVGDGCVIGAHAVVSKSVEPYSIVVGNPGRVIKKRFSRDRIDKLMEMKWWDWELKDIGNALKYLESEDTDGLYNYWKSMRS